MTKRDIEIDEDAQVVIDRRQLQILQQGQDVLDKLWTDPKEGLAFKRKVKALKPDWAIPEVDVVDQAAAPFRAEIDSLKKDVTDLVDTIKTERKSAKEKAEETDLQAQIEGARRKYQLTDEGMEKVFARMKEKNNPDVESAAAWVTDHMPKAQPIKSSGFGPQALNLFGSKTQDDNWADLHKDPDAWFDKTVGDILDNPQNYPELRGFAA